jgi:hypothetical protein
MPYRPAVIPEQKETKAMTSLFSPEGFALFRVIISKPMPKTTIPRKTLSIHEAAYFNRRVPGMIPQKMQISMNNDFLMEKFRRFFHDIHPLNGTDKSKFIGEITRFSINMDNAGLEIKGSPKAASPLNKKSPPQSGGVLKIPP